MTVDYTEFPFPGIIKPTAATLTEAITFDPVEPGFVVVALKTGDGTGIEASIRAFEQSLRAASAENGLQDVTAYREIRREELGGAVPFD